MISRAFHPMDLLRIVPKGIHSDTAAFQQQTVLRLYEMGCPIVSFTEKDEIVAIFGLIVHWAKVAECWAVVSDLAHNKPLTFHRQVLSVINEYEKKFSLHRMQITVRSDYVIGCRWAKSLGFKREGLMKKYMPNGGSHYLYARTV